MSETTIIQSSSSQAYAPEEMLAEVNKAIQAILVGGQSYKIGSRSLTRADLSLLRQMQNDLIAQVNASKETSLMQDTYVAVFDGR